MFNHYFVFSSQYMEGTSIHICPSPCSAPICGQLRSDILSKFTTTRYIVNATLLLTWAADKVVWTDNISDSKCKTLHPKKYDIVKCEIWLCCKYCCGTLRLGEQAGRGSRGKTTGGIGWGPNIYISDTLIFINSAIYIINAYIISAIYISWCCTFAKFWYFFCLCHLT